MAIIEVEKLSRVYKAKIGIFSGKTKEILALTGLDLEVAEGELFGIMGPNGAGKTTTIKILTTLLTPSIGNAKVLGYDVVNEAKKIRPHIGFIFGGERGLYWRLSAYDNLVYFANLYHVSPTLQKRRIPQLLDLVGLRDRGDEKVQGYSRGMKQRLHIARALLHDPKILFLDEPTIGLDPIGARELRQVIKNFQGENKTIILTTHYMLEADNLCDRIAIIDQGKLVALDTPRVLKQIVQDLAVVEIEVDRTTPETTHLIETIHGVKLLSITNKNEGIGCTLRIHTANGPAVIAPITQLLEGIGLRVINIFIHEPTLDDAYIRLLGGQE